MIDTSKLSIASYESKWRKALGGMQEIKLRLLYDDLFLVDIVHRDFPNEPDCTETTVKFIARQGYSLIPDPDFLKYEAVAKRWRSKEEYEAGNYDPKFIPDMFSSSVLLKDIDEFCENTLVSRDLTLYIKAHIDDLLQNKITE